MATARAVLNHALLDHLARDTVVLQHWFDAVTDQNRGFAHVRFPAAGERDRTAHVCSDCFQSGYPCRRHVAPTGPALSLVTAENPRRGSSATCLTSPPRNTSGEAMPPRRCFAS